MIRVMPVRHCTRAVLLIVAAQTAAWPSPAGAQQPGASTTRGYTVFVRGSVVGREDVTVRTDEDGITITGKGRLNGSPQIIIRRAEVRYRLGWVPERYVVEASVNGGDTNIETTFSGGTAVTKGVDGGEQVSHTDTVPQRVMVLSNIFFGSFEALTRQLAGAPPGRELAVFVNVGAQASLRVTGAGAERVQVGTSILAARRYEISLVRPHGTTVMHVYADADGSLLRINIPEGAVDVVRDDLAAATARTVVYSNPTDEAVIIPSAGFNLGATLTRPASASRAPAVILLAGAAANERDGIVADVPILGQLAGALAQAGVLAVRYDKRGHGQSGGRAESATLADHAEDALAVVRWLRSRRDVDGDRIAVLGHNEGAWTALLVGSRERRIAAVVSMAAPSTTGAERVLEQQRQVLDRLQLPDAERAAKIDLQTRINSAAMTGRDWEHIPADMRKQADTPWFQSFLRFDPARVIEDVRQPLLILHGAIDAEVPVSHAERLGELARKERRSRSVSVVTVRGVNHLLTPAVTGGVDEYASLQDRTLSTDVTNAVGEWLTKTFAAVR